MYKTHHFLLMALVLFIAAAVLIDQRATLMGVVLGICAFLCNVLAMISYGKRQERLYTLRQQNNSEANRLYAEARRHNS